MDIKLTLNPNGRGSFYFEENDKVIGRMNIGIADGKLIAYHTEVEEEARGMNLGKKLLETMVNYAREHKLKVVPLCPFVNAQFRRHKELYADLVETA